MRVACRSLLLGAIALAGCHLADPVDVSDARLGDAETRDGSFDANDGDNDEGDGLRDVDGSPRGGPLTVVAETFSLLTERLCDLDGDGMGDNALADLGDVEGALLARAIDSLIQSRIANGALLPILHFPWIDDLATPSDSSAVAIFFEGFDLDVPHDPTDDYSGEEPFQISNSFIDACGEPLHLFPAMSVTEGVLSGTAEELPLPGIDNFVLRGVQGTGTLGPDGRDGFFEICAAGLLADMGDASAGDLLPGFSFLELLVAGGSALGIAALPGLAPNLDFDGDGIERIELSADGHVARCIDGDGTLIDDDQCWNDPRMADGIAMAWRLDMITARFEGRRPNWEDSVEGTCDDPPETSAFDPQ